MGNLLLNLSKAESFDMTIMMVEDDEKEILRELFTRIRGKDSSLADKVEQAYED